MLEVFDDLEHKDFTHTTTNQALCITSNNSQQELDMVPTDISESNDMILLEHVPIVTPNRDVIVEDLSFQVN